jgi:hypothetical protein
LDWPGIAAAMATTNSSNASSLAFAFTVVVVASVAIPPQSLKRWRCGMGNAMHKPFSSDHWLAQRAEDALRGEQREGEEERKQKRLPPLFQFVAKPARLHFFLSSRFFVGLFLHFSFASSDSCTGDLLLSSGDTSRMSEVKFVSHENTSAATTMEEKKARKKKKNEV